MTTEQATLLSASVWEPWQPQVGDRVRILLSGECGYHREVPRDILPLWAMRAMEAGFFARADGATGVVEYISRSDEEFWQECVRGSSPAEAERIFRSMLGHWYCVKFDHPVVDWAGTQVFGGVFNRVLTHPDDIFAAVELELLEATRDH